MRPPPLPRKRATSCGRPVERELVGHHRVRPQRGRVRLVQLDLGAVSRAAARPGAPAARAPARGGAPARVRHGVERRRARCVRATSASRRAATASTTRCSWGESCMTRYRSPRERQLRRARAPLAALRARGGARARARALRRRGRRERARLAPGSERARSTRPSGRFVLKIANAAFGEAELDLQNRAMAHLAERLPFEVPQPCRARSTAARSSRVERDGVTYLRPARDVHRGRAADRRARTSRRRCCARSARSPGQVARALEDFEHPAADRAMQWDPRHVGAVVEALAPHVEDPRRRALVERVAARRAAADRAPRAAPAHARSCTAT